MYKYSYKYFLYLEGSLPFQGKLEKTFLFVTQPYLNTDTYTKIHTNTTLYSILTFIEILMVFTRDISPIRERLKRRCCLQLNLLNTIQSAVAKLMQICKKVNWKRNSNDLLLLPSLYILYCDTNAIKMQYYCDKNSLRKLMYIHNRMLIENVTNNKLLSTIFGHKPICHEMKLAYQTSFLVRTKKVWCNMFRCNKSVALN